MELPIWLQFDEISQLDLVKSDLANLLALENSCQGRHSHSTVTYKYNDNCQVSTIAGPGSG